MFTGEIPCNGGAVVVETQAACIHFAAQCGQVWDSTLSQAEAAEQAHFDFSLIEPTAMLGSVMDSEAAPQQTAYFLAIAFDERFAAVRIQVIRTRWMVRT